MRFIKFFESVTILEISKLLFPTWARKVFFLALLILLCLYLRFGFDMFKQNPWAETTATITYERLDNGSHGFMIEYDASKSTAVNVEGRKILGPIQQFGTLKKQPIEQQKIKIRYLKEEPIVYETIDPIQYSLDIL